MAVPDSRLAASPAASPPLEATDDHRLTQESFRAICSANQRAGRWEAADEIRVLAICGEVTLDFTRAELPPSGVIEIHAWSICGEVKIIVPAGAEIELEGEPILGSIEQEVREAGARDEDLPAPPPEPPYFRIDGRAILGTIKVVTDR